MKKIQFDDKTNTSPEARKIKTKNFIAKILCVVAAICLWYYAASNDVTVFNKDFTVDVSIEGESDLNARTGWSVLSGKDNSVVITLSGKKSSLNNLDKADLEAYVDVSDIQKTGKQTLDIQVSKPTDCQITDISSTSLTTYIDKKTQSNVKVDVQYKDYSLSKNCELQVVCKPTEITVSGAESELSKVAYAKAVLSLGNQMINEKITSNCSLVLIDEQGNEFTSNYVSMLSSSVVVTVTPYAEKEVPLKLDYKYGYFNDTNVKVGISPEKVVLKGEPGVLDEIDGIVLATLDEKQFGENTSVNLSIPIPSDTELVGAVNTADVKVEHINTTLKKITVENIELLNTNGLNCTVETKDLVVTLRGTYQALSEINASDIHATVNMQAYSSGSGLTKMPVDITINSENSDSVYEIGTYEAFVTVN